MASAIEPVMILHQARRFNEFSQFGLSASAVSNSEMASSTFPCRRSTEPLA